MAAWQKAVELYSYMASGQYGKMANMLYLYEAICYTAIQWGVHAKKHPASLQGTLGFLGLRGLYFEKPWFPCEKKLWNSLDVRVGFLVEGLLWPSSYCSEAL